MPTNPHRAAGVGGADDARSTQICASDHNLRAGRMQVYSSDRSSSDGGREATRADISANGAPNTRKRIKARQAEHAAVFEKLVGRCCAQTRRRGTTVAGAAKEGRGWARRQGGPLSPGARDHPQGSAPKAPGWPSLRESRSGGSRRKRGASGEGAVEARRKDSLTSLPTAHLV